MTLTLVKTLKYSLVLGSVGGALLTAGCGGSAEAPEEPEIAHAQPVRSSSDIALPMDAYYFNAEEEAQIAQAHHELMVACGERFGVEITMPPMQNPPLEHMNARRYGVISVEEASRYGTRRPPSDLSEDNSEDNKDGPNAWNPSDLELVVVRGAENAGVSVDPPEDNEGNPLPTGGCVAEVEETLAPIPLDLAVADRLANEAHSLAENDSRVAEAMDTWSSCMGDAGFDYATPSDVYNAGWPDEVTQEEIAAAIADAECKQETQLVEVWMTVEAAYQQQSIETNADELQALQDWHDERIRRAAEVLSNG